MTSAFRIHRLSCFGASALLFAGCGGDYSDLAGGGRPAPQGTGDAQSHFTAKVQPELDFCRSCHVPDGVADTDQGRRFQLSQQRDEDYDRTQQAWAALGRGVGTNLLLTMPAGTAPRSHSGGAPWPPGSSPHKAMRSQLQCWESGGDCRSTNGGGGGQNAALIGGAGGGHLWPSSCDGAPDSTPLPIDPRSLIHPRVNAGRAVVFNVDWQECALNDPLRPQNCGEYRALLAIGERVGRGQGEPGSAHMFSGDAASGIDAADPSTFSSDASFWTLSATQYNTLWQYWSGWFRPPAARPPDFDALVAERYGSPLPVQRNPYPLPGEDPNALNGGSGQLPLALTQLRDADGNWTGTIAVKLCSFCHDGQLDLERREVIYGGAGAIGDFSVAFRDFAAAGARQFGLLSGLPLTIAANRGSGAIDQFQIGFIAFNGGDPDQFRNDKILLSQAIGNIKSPPWWNLGSRPQKFHGAALSTDSARIDLAAYYPLGGGPSDPVAWIDAVAYPFQLWAEALQPPAWPGAVDEALATQGAVLFHAKDLWAPGLDNPVPPPPERGNGACASCHGVYSPRYAADPAFLADPRLAGMAANIVPLDVIDTDPAYAEAIQSLRNEDGSIPESFDENVFLSCGIGAAGYTPNNTPVMLAPPLHGIWASAPYFHNASVPNVWGVLDPSSERPGIWKRQSAPAPAGLEGRVVMGFDTDFIRAYDSERLGWRYQALDCLEDAAQTAPVLSCNPLPVGAGEDPGASPLQPLFDFIYGELALGWNLSVDEALVQPMTDPQIENRKIFNTHLYSQGNQGHAFTAVLTDVERRALVEYLKTL